MSIPDITVVTPSIPPRAQSGDLLDRAVASVKNQTLLPSGGHVVTLDVERAGAAKNRQRALDAVHTEWVAFLDDDDTFYPHHLETLAGIALSSGADYVWSWFDGNNPFPGHRGKPMNIHQPHHTTMTVLVKTDIAKAAGFYQDAPLHKDWSGEDWQFELRCIEEIRKKYGDEVAPSKFASTSEITWTYAVHGRNTSGLATRW